MVVASVGAAVGVFVGDMVGASVGADVGGAGMHLRPLSPEPGSVSPHKTQIGLSMLQPWSTPVSSAVFMQAGLKLQTSVVP